MATAPEFYPNILLRKLMIGRKEVNLGDYYTDGGKALSFKGAKASFSLSFVVPDFLTGGDVEYSYMLDGFDKDWTSFSSINEASYLEIPSGSYVLKVRYKKDVFNTEYKVSFYGSLCHLLAVFHINSRLSDSFIKKIFSPEAYDAAAVDSRKQ